MTRPSPGLLKELWEEIQKHPNIEYEISYSDLAIIYSVLLNLLYSEGWLKERAVLTQTVLQWRREREGGPPTQRELNEAFGSSSIVGGVRRRHFNYNDPYDNREPYSYITPLPKKNEKKDTITTGELIQNEVRRLKTKGGPAKKPELPPPEEETLDGHAEAEADRKASIKRRKRGDGEW